MTNESSRRLRSRAWFDNPDDPDMTAIYLERYLNYGLTRQELQSNKPIIGIAQSGSDLSPCNRPLMDLANRTREGIRDAGGVAIEFPTHPIQESGKRPTASLDRNLAYLGLVEILYGYPLDAVVLTTGCDKTTPALLMAAATVDIPAIVLTGGPMLNGWYKGERAGSGTINWKARELLAAGEIDYEGFMEMAASSAPSPGFCNTMGTAMTLNSLAEVLGMSLPGCAAIPAPHRERAQIAYETGRRIVEMTHENLTPSKILTKKAFENAIVVNSALGGSSNAPIHIKAVASHIGVDLDLSEWERIGGNIPLLVNLQPAGMYLAEDFHRAGGVPAVVGTLINEGLINESALTVTGKSIGENTRGITPSDTDVIRPFAEPLKAAAGFRVVQGNLFDAAVMKTSTISETFRATYLNNPDDPMAFEGRAVVFDGPEDFHKRIDDPALNIDAKCILFMRGTGPIGYPGAAEVVNMRAPDYLISQGITELPCIGDGRQSGTSGSPSILNASPEAAVGGGLALLKTGDKVRVDLNTGRVDALVAETEWMARQAELTTQGGYSYPESKTPWQEIQRGCVDQLANGMVLKPALKYQRISTKGLPRHNH